MAARADAAAGLIDRRLEAGERYFAGEADRIAELCRLLAERFLRGGRLLAVGGSPQAWSDARHVAVEFVHPVIVGKRALPALAVGPDELSALARPDDAVIAFDVCDMPDGCLAIEFTVDDDDPFVRQELVETSYHVLWELVHVFLDHLDGSTAGAGASSFLYPFLQEQTADLAAVTADVRASVLAKAQETADLRVQTVAGARDELAAAAATLREGGTLLAFGNGGSATDAMDVVADFRAAGRRAIDLTADSAILTAIANDVGPELLFSRQVIAYGHPGDVALALSTSGSSVNIIEALAEARRRGLHTIAFVGYDGGRIAADRLADHVVVTPSQHIPRIQEAQATAYHVLLELLR
jgi:D-sedoheptulose 7-phosphate isomerase